MPLATNPFTQEVAAGNAQIGRWLSLCSKFIAMRWPCLRRLQMRLCPAKKV